MLDATTLGCGSSVSEGPSTRNGEFQAAVQSSDAFVGMLAHDLRVPLASIMCGASLLRHVAMTSESDEIIDRILSSADRMRRMIRQMLDLALVRAAGGIPISAVRVHLGQICSNIVCELETATSALIQIHLDGDLYGSWDPDRLGQVLSNLLSNAIQHGQPKSEIVIHVDGTRRSTVILSVRNEGAISESALPSLFEAFEMRRARTAREGLGLGLFISRQIIQQHGGNITVHSSKEEGTTFVVELSRETPIANISL